MRLICAAAALLVFAAIPLPALAEVTEDVTVSTTAAYDDMALQSASACLADYAVVREVGEDYVLVALRGDGSGENIQLNVGVMTTLLDNKSGAFAQLADVQVGDNIYVYYSQKKTRSLPPQSNLLLLLTNVGDDAPAHFLTVESFEADTEGTFFLNVDDEGELILTVPEAAWTNSDELSGIYDGALVAAWYDTVMLSLPAQAVADRAVLLTARRSMSEVAGADGYREEIKDLSVIVGGEKELHSVVEYSGGVAMVPLRAVAEALGFEVTWNGVEQSVHLTNGSVQTSVQIGVDSYFTATAVPGMVGMSAPQTLGAAPYMQNQQKTYVPAALFEMLGENVTTDCGMLLIAYPQAD
jgi:hypothetical protein